MRAYGDNNFREPLNIIVAEFIVSLTLERDVAHQLLPKVIPLYTQIYIVVRRGLYELIAKSQIQILCFVTRAENIFYCM